MSFSLSTLLGVARYEFRMQVKRPGIWITFAVVTFYIIFIAMGGPGEVSKDIKENIAHLPLLIYMADFTYSVNQYLPIFFGCLLADRLVRDRRLKTEEIMNTTGASVGTRLLGKYFGNLCATIVPMLAVYAIVLCYIVYVAQNLMAIPMFLLTFVTIALPGLLFVTAFSLACPLFMPVSLYMFLYVGYWVWGNMFLKQQQEFSVPSLSRTILTPSGTFIVNGLFNQGHKSTLVTATPLQAVESICLLLCITMLVLVGLWRFLKWQQARR
ncbi:MAG TPA: hypothetical protein VN729_12605 [Ktedonobacteraceae bacterium]|nr:hypothetical protein [Ktedonobacteraceae bacterium]